MTIEGWDEDDGCTGDCCQAPDPPAPDRSPTPLLPGPVALLARYARRSVDELLRIHRP